LQAKTNQTPRIDISFTEASIDRLIVCLIACLIACLNACLIVFQERNDNFPTSSFSREWATFLGPNEHLASAANTQIGMQIMILVRRTHMDSKNS
jgi:hypothetical protein